MEADFVSQAFQSFHEMVCETLGVELIEILDSQIVVFGFRDETAIHRSRPARRGRQPLRARFLPRRAASLEYWALK